jgi:hypothetical protein
MIAIRTEILTLVIKSLLCTTVMVIKSRQQKFRENQCLSIKLTVSTG